MDRNVYCLVVSMAVTGSFVGAYMMNILVGGRQVPGKRRLELGEIAAIGSEAAYGSQW